MFNRKRVAISAFVVGALVYPALTGSWRSFEFLSDEFKSVWRQADQQKFYDTVIAARGITRDQFDKELKEQQERCIQESREHDKGRDNGMLGEKAWAVELIRQYVCLHPLLDHLPGFNFRAALLGLFAATYDVRYYLHKFIFDALIGGIGGAAFVWFGPALLGNCFRLLARYLRWLRTTD